jgi:hypothetical protein
MGVRKLCPGFVHETFQHALEDDLSAWRADALTSGDGDSLLTA